MKLRRNEPCPIHRSLFCCGRESMRKQRRFQPGVLRVEEENHLPVAQVQNAAGKYVSPTAAGTSAAIDAFSGELSKDVRAPIVNAPASAPDAYPISGLTFLLVPKQARDLNKAGEVKGFVQYIITGGQGPAEQLHYAKIPASLQQIDQELLQQVQGGS